MMGTLQRQIPWIRNCEDARKLALWQDAQEHLPAVCRAQNVSITMTIIQQQRYL